MTSVGAGGVSAALIVTGVTATAVGGACLPHILPHIRKWLGAIWPRTARDAEAALLRIDELRRLPEVANMYFLSRFIAMTVLQSIDDTLVDLITLLPGLGSLSEKAVTLPLGLMSLALAAECLVTYRRMADFESIRRTMIRNVSANSTAADLDHLRSIGTE